MITKSLARYNGNWCMAAKMQKDDVESRLKYSLACRDQVVERRSLTAPDRIGSKVVWRLSDTVLRFAINSIQNTLGHNVNLKRWKKSSIDFCPLCHRRQTLLHVLNNCPIALTSGRYTWRHNSVLFAIYIVILSWGLLQPGNCQLT